MQPMPPTTASDFVAALLAASLQAPAAGDPLEPLASVGTTDLARASQFFECALGFEIHHRIPNVAAQVRWGSTAAMLLQFGARPARFERAQRLVDATPFRAGAVRIATLELHRLHRHMQSSLQRHGVPAELTPPQWQPWNAWECHCLDPNGNTLVFTQAARGGAPQP